tara:strand:+ start:2327 stop:2569 length:243 start_codon:yes stop_codon:yes gene_type:complete
MFKWENMISLKSSQKNMEKAFLFFPLRILGELMMNGGQIIQYHANTTQFFWKTYLAPQYLSIESEEGGMSKDYKKWHIPT